jgi:hypothetical protein
MKPFLMGSETEYAVSGRNRHGTVLPGDVHARLCDALRRERRCLPDVTGDLGIYLENGGRLYMDSGQHPEYATPECFTPAQVACYDKAGERLLELAWTRLLEENRDLEITILKNNLSPTEPDGITWGTHESYTCWATVPTAVAALVPHLATRIIYAGAGCLSAFAGGTGFELSQRARHIVRAVSAATTNDRALFCTRTRSNKDRGKRGEWFRAHLIGKDAQRAPFGIYLTFGVTGLLFLMLNAGRRVGQGLALQDAVAAMRAISCDPWLRTSVPLADGRRLTALEIQESYLTDCERELQKGEFPSWAGEVVRHWRETLAGLANNPLALARKLDPYCKLLMYEHELRRAQTSWAELRQALHTLAGLHRTFPAGVVQAVLSEDPDRLPAPERPAYRSAVADFRLSEGGMLDRLRLAVRLQVFDLHYHEVGGLYDQLAAAGGVQGVVVSPGDIDRATREAPAGGRAEVRGEHIRSLPETEWLCEWRYLYHPSTDQFVDLRDPFGEQGPTVSLTALGAVNGSDPEMREIVYQLGRRC